MRCPLVRLDRGWHWNIDASWGVRPHSPFSPSRDFINRMTSFSMCIPFYVFHTRPFVTVCTFVAGRRFFKLTSGFGLVLEPRLVALACPTIDILFSVDCDLKITPRSCICKRWGSKQWQCSADSRLQWIPILCGRPPPRDLTEREKCDLKRKRAHNIGLIAILSNDCNLKKK